MAALLEEKLRAEARAVDLEQRLQQAIEAVRTAEERALKLQKEADVEREATRPTWAAREGRGTREDGGMDDESLGLPLPPAGVAVGGNDGDGSGGGDDAGADALGATRIVDATVSHELFSRFLTLTFCDLENASFSELVPRTRNIPR